MLGCIPLVVDAKELPNKYPTRVERAFHACKHLAKPALGNKRERKLGIDEIVGLERKLLKRRLDDLHIPLLKAPQDINRVRIAIDSRHLKSLLQQIARISPSSRAQIKGATFVGQQRHGPYYQCPGWAAVVKSLKVSPRNFLT